jgi:hypothetical protein
MKRNIPCFAFLAALAVVPAIADAGDPPSRVARLSYRSGPVSFRPGSVEEWTDAALNYPLTTGDHLWTEAGARTEMHIGSTAIRMDSATALAFLNLDDRTVQLSLTEGSITLRLRYLAEDESFEIDTPNAAIMLLRPGVYRIDADSDRNLTAVTVRSGQADVTVPGSTFPVHGGQSARVIGVDTVSQDLAGALPLSELERWAEGRDMRAERAESVRYVGSEMTGYEDLDEYGVWRDEPQYGWVWAPRAVAVGWAPYRFGRWAWVDPWGWTWIDDAPWGFAPFHYGRWAYFGGRWVWLPGAIGMRPVYAPALVAFVGGPRFGIGVRGGGYAGWFPLGPREVYRPAYHVSDGYVRRVNVTHVTNINVVNVTNVTNVRYVNQGVAGAVTVVPHDAILRSRAVQREAVSAPQGELATAPVAGSAPQVAPGRDSVLMGGTRAGAPPRRIAERGVVARTAPPAPPVPFEARQRNLEAAQGRPLDAGTLEELRQRNPGRGPAVRTMAPGRSAMPVQAPAPSAVPVPAAPEAPRGGWRRGTPTDRPDPQPRPVERQLPTAPTPSMDTPRPPRVREDQPLPPRPRIEERQPAPQPRDVRPPRVEERPAAPPPAPVREARPPRVEERPAAPPPAPVREARPPRVEDRPAPPPARVESPRSERPREASPESRPGRGGDRPAEQKDDKGGGRRGGN